MSLHTREDRADLFQVSYILLDFSICTEHPYMFLPKLKGPAEQFQVFHSLRFLPVCSQHLYVFCLYRASLIFLPKCEDPAEQFKGSSIL